MSLSIKKVDIEIWKIADSEVIKMRKWKNPVKKDEKRTNEDGSTEGKVEAAEGSTDARRKVEIGCTEVPDGEEVPAILYYEKYWRL